ncbi:hypothetical protein MUK42_19427 [Musa troglodytarum]|uniref:Uncharacterized protein n=1 Tax=Musa troglodytarum TaxID=320322 RepID=A0A9E7FUC7_9LILI|nr:hypothetical protein MUK42_19427 [Musa troglodytarum]
MSTGETPNTGFLFGMIEEIKIQFLREEFPPWGGLISAS